MKKILNYVNELKETFKSCKRVNTNLDEYYILQSIHYQNIGIL